MSTEQPSNVNSSEIQTTTEVNIDQAKEQPSGMSTIVKVILIIISIIVVLTIILSIYLYFHGWKYFGTSAGTIVNGVVWYNYKFYNDVLSLKPPMK